MEWITCLKQSIDYIEDHLLDNFSIEEVADRVHISPFYLQKGFKILTGYTITEYIKCRRLYMAALDVIAGNEKVIELAYKYGYDTPESFTKAFGRFHRVTPMQMRMRGNASKIKTFLPLKISVSIQGGNDMDFVVEKMSGFKVVGFEREFLYDTSYSEIPKFWCEFYGKYENLLMEKTAPADAVEETICHCMVGEFGVCISDLNKEGKFRYLIAGKYTGGDVPEGMVTYELPDTEWAKFRCIGPMPGALQAVNTKIFSEWLPGNSEYNLSLDANIEWYAKGDTSAPDYESAIWLPVERKKAF